MLDASTAAAVSTAISLILPYLKNAADATSKKAGEAVFEWLRHRLFSSAVKSSALTELRLNPDDSPNQDKLRQEMIDQLNLRQDLLLELKSLLQKVDADRYPPSVVKQRAGEHSVQFGTVFGNVKIDNK
jgi:hypothetical protein